MMISFGFSEIETGGVEIENHVLAMCREGGIRQVGPPVSGLATR